jgi:hypothetical protein
MPYHGLHHVCAAQKQPRERNPDTYPPGAGVFPLTAPEGEPVAMATQQTKTISVDTGSHEPPQVAALKALQEARKHRHHPDCRCFRYQRLYCTPADAVWQNAVNRELSNLAGQRIGQHLG